MSHAATVEGRDAVVAYLAFEMGGGFREVAPAEATLIKVIFADGGMKFYTPIREKGEKFYSEDQPRDERGRWTETGAGGVPYGHMPPPMTEHVVGEVGGIRMLEKERTRPNVSASPNAAYLITRQETGDKALRQEASVAPGGGGIVMHEDPRITATGNRLEAEINEALDRLPPEHYDALNTVEVKTSRGNGNFAEYFDTTRNIFVYVGDDHPERTSDDRVTHEIGHHVHMTKMTTEAAAEWEELSKNGSRARITDYAKNCAGEHFAEAYRYYNSKFPHLREALREEEPRVWEFMEKLRKGIGILPKGKIANTITQGRRYAGLPNVFARGAS